MVVRGLIELGAKGTKIGQGDVARLAVASGELDFEGEGVGGFANAGFGVVGTGAVREETPGVFPFGHFASAVTGNELADADNAVRVDLGRDADNAARFFR